MLRVVIYASSTILYNRHQHFCHVTGAGHRGYRRLTCPHNPQERGSGVKGSFHGAIGGFSMTCDPGEAAIDRIVASCNGDLRGALKALLLVNEQLEAELQHLHAAVAHGEPGERGSKVLH
jgi:hypothetical protein